MINLKRILILTALFFVLPCASIAAYGTDDTYRIAYDKGFTDGEISGRSDRQNGDGYDYSRWPEFLAAGGDDARQDYDPEVFNVAYRRGFKDGYENGYNDPYAGLSQPRPAESQENKASLGNLPESPEWILPGGTKIMVRLLDPLSTEINNQGDRFIAELAENVELSEAVFIPEHTRIYGEISHLKRAGRIRGRAEMELQFNRIEISRGYSLSLNAEMVGLIQNPMRRIESEDGTVRQDSGVKGDLGRIGASAGIGALIGVITGGGSGAGKGAIVGAAGGLVGTVLTRGDDIHLLSETEVVIRLVDDLNIPKNRIDN